MISKTITKQAGTDWDALEQEQRTRLRELTDKLEMLEAKRGDSLLAFGEQKIEKGKIEDLEKKIKDCRLEIEGTESVLKAIPRRRAFAQAEENEKELEAIASLQTRITELAANVDDQAEAFALAVSNLYKAVSELSPFTPTSHTPFLNYDLGILDSLGIAFRAHDLFKFVKVGKFRDAMSASEAIKRGILRDTAKLINKKGEFIKVLRGELKAGSNRCPECYETLKLRYLKGDKYYCENCGFEVMK